MKPGQASTTAEYVALFRALESVRPASKRLFYDPFAVRFLRPSWRWLVRAASLPGIGPLLWRHAERLSAGSMSSAIARTRLIDETVHAALDLNVQQVVILGAGFDSRAYRIALLCDIPVFEVDHPDTQKRKRMLVESVAYATPQLRMVAMDFNRDDLTEKMASAGYNPAAPTIYLWEGVTNYLDADAVDRMFDWFSWAASGSSVVFTYVDRRVLDQPETFSGAARLLEQLDRFGERWKFGFIPDQLPQYLADRGLRLQDDQSAAQYRAKYLGWNEDRARGYEFYHVAQAQLAGNGKSTRDFPR